MARPSPIPAAAGAILRLAARLVPRSRRDDWLREWRGEICHRHARAGAGSLDLVGRSLGSLPDAFWLRTHEWSPDMLMQDLRFAVRAHLRRPGLALVAVLTLSLGIGATTALFSIVNGILLEPLPYPDSQRLVRLYGSDTGLGARRTNMNPLDLMDVRERAESLAGLAYETSATVTLTGGEEPLRLQASYVASSFFDVLGAEPALGRWFLPEEDVAGNHRVAVLSHEAWRRLFGGDAAILGTSVSLGGEPYTVVGVAPRGFRGPFQVEPADLWLPWPYDPASTGRGGHFMRAVARLAPGATTASAQQEIDTIYARIAAEFDKPTRGLGLVPLHEATMGEARPILLALMGAVVAVLLIVCANLAGLLLARASGRTREVAVRVALGASRSRILRQMLTESLLLSLLGGATGIGVATLLVGTVGVRLAALLPTDPGVSLDLRVLAFALGVSILTGVVFGLAPALQVARSDVREGVQDGSGGASGRSRTALRTGLVVAEVGLSLILLMGAGLLLRSFANLLSTETGYDPHGVLTARLSVPESDYPEYAATVTFYDRLRERVAALPSVTAAGAINRLPLGGSYSCDGFHLEGWPTPEPGHWECAEERVVTPGYFEAMGIDLLRGRLLQESDTADADPVVVISRTMADRYFEGEDPLGRGFKWGPPDETPYRRVVGVVEDVKHGGLDADAMPEVYMPQAQYPYYRTMYLAVRTAGDPSALVGVLRRQLHDMDADIPLFDVATMEQRMSGSVMARRIVLLVLGAFAVVALLLACIGLYGILAYAVTQRTREIGIRIALGAHGGTVTALVLRRGLALAIAGVAAGTLGWWLIGRSLRGLLYRVGVDDPLTLGMTAALLLALAALASYLPARRATRIDPVRALRT